VLNNILFLLFTSITIAMEVSYPDWFLFPFSYPDYITGFSKGEFSSLEDASNMYCFYNETIVNGNMYRYNDYDEKISDYYWYFPPKCVEDIKSKLFSVSSFISNVITNSIIELYGYPPFLDVLDPGAVKGENNQTTILDVILFLDSHQNPEIQNTDFHNYLKLADISAPDWINNDFWESDNYYYSVGMYTSQGEKNDAWKTAEERAFFNLVTTLAVGFSNSSVDKIVEHLDFSITEEYEEILRYKLFHKIVDAQVIARWPDINNNLYFVQVRIHEDNILSPYLNSNGKKNK